METRTASSQGLTSAVTLARIKAALDQVPVDRLNDVYAYLIELQEDAEDLAAIEEFRTELVNSGSHGIPLEDYLRERGMLDEIENAAKAEGLINA